jgi:hypothetical protein
MADRGFREVLDENLGRNASSRAGDRLDCRRCGAAFERGDWCFHQLCDACFGRFDRAKMAGRFGQGPPCEDVAVWAASEAEGSAS